MSIPSYIPASQKDADKVAEVMDADKRASVYEMFKYWERRMIEMRVGAIATAFENSKGLQMLGGSCWPTADRRSC